jgi:hypothetical protein
VIPRRGFLVSSRLWASPSLALGPGSTRLSIILFEARSSRSRRASPATRSSNSLSMSVALRRFRCTMRINCGELDPGAVIRPVIGEWHPHMPKRLDEEELADRRVGRNAVYQLGSPHDRHTPRGRRRLASYNRRADLSGDVARSFFMTTFAALSTDVRN